MVGLEWREAHERSARHLLNEYCYRQSPTRATIVRTIDLDWPAAAQVREQIMRYYSPNLTADGIPIANTMVAQGIESYEQARANGAGDWSRWWAFLEAVCDRAAKLTAGLRVTDQAKNRRWRPDQGVALEDWLQGPREVHLEIEQPSDQEHGQIRRALQDYFADTIREWPQWQRRGGRA